MNILKCLITIIRQFIPAPAEYKSRHKLIFNTTPDVIYAIGDIHGCYDQLIALEKTICADAQLTAGKKLLVFLGDYVDRGPKSAAVLDFLITRSQAHVPHICLAGNHEEVMLDYIQNPSLNHPWLKHGGYETLNSYGIYSFPQSRKKLKYQIDSHIPDEHITFLESLPSLLYFSGFCFVHAGIDDNVPLAKQKDATLLWTHPPIRAATAKNTFTVVHGHTAIEKVDISHGYINVDTGAYKSGVLSAIKISENGELHILTFETEIKTSK